MVLFFNRISRNRGRRAKVGRTRRQHGPYYCGRLSERVDNRFLLVQMAIKRVHQYREGYEPLLETRNKEVVTALRKIAAGKVMPDDKSLYNPCPTGSDAQYRGLRSQIRACVPVRARRTGTDVSIGRAALPELQPLRLKCRHFKLYAARVPRKRSRWGVFEPYGCGSALPPIPRKPFWASGHGCPPPAASSHLGADVRSCGHLGNSLLSIVNCSQRNST